MRLALVLVVVFAFPATASASTAKVVIGDTCGDDVACSKYNGGQPSPIVTYLGAPGEANRLTVRREGRAITLSDPAATVVPEAPCVVLDAHSASCDGGKPTPQGADRVAVQLGDGDDSVTVAPGLQIVASLAGGAGDDTLAGGDEDDDIDGGRGADRIDAGAGMDVLSFADRRDGVTADAATGRTSDGDVFASVETIRGGDGPDRLLGGPAPDGLDGRGGDDTLRGRGGQDTLVGGLGRDRIDGGAGDDYLSGDPEQGDGYYTPIVRLRRDLLRGGPGDDTLTDTGGANLLEGGPGDDLLVGGVGADRLFGGRGADRLYGDGGGDRLFGGLGPDRLFARDGRRDLVACGGGRDSARIDAKDRVRACERVRRRGYTQSR